MNMRPIRPLPSIPGVAILWLLTGIPLGPTAAQRPAKDPDDLPSQVEALVSRLADQDPAVRDDAERQLLALGTRILPLLPRPSSGATPEIKLRLARVRNRIHRRDLEETVHPSRVVLMGDMTLEEALGAIESQTSNRVVDEADRHAGRPDEGQLSLQLDDVSFWQAIDALLRQSHSQLDAFAGKPNTLSLRSVPTTQSDRAHDGPLTDGDSILRGEVLRVARVVDWRRIPRDSLRIDVELIWEPRLAPLEIRFATNELTAEDDLGNVLHPIGDAGQEVAIISDRSGGIQRLWQFEAPPVDSRRLKSIATDLNLLLASPFTSFTFSNLETPSNQRGQQPGVTVAIQEVRRLQDSCEIRISVAYDGDSPAFESHRVWIYDNPAFLQDRQGVVTKPQSKEISMQRGSTFELTFRFDVDDLRDLSFHYSTPRTFFLARIPIEFHDVPLP